MPLLVAALFAAFATTAFAAWAGGRLGQPMPSNARALFCGIALVFAGGEMLFLRIRKAPAEPTRSVFAALLVMAALQITDAARFLVLALAAWTAAPISVALGGAAAAGGALVTVWLWPELLDHRAVSAVRRVAGAGLLMLGLAIAVPHLIG